ncbi:hypothetical protein CR983_02885 [Candidatus Saccharibacteria bacterium]|nr:MAG: hypothetical protein CR983_02885 [Candidatus Saccharibacteria bacterium]
MAITPERAPEEGQIPPTPPIHPETDYTGEGRGTSWFDRLPEGQKKAVKGLGLAAATMVVMGGGVTALNMYNVNKATESTQIPEQPPAISEPEQPPVVGEPEGELPIDDPYPETATEALGLEGYTGDQLLAVVNNPDELDKIEDNYGFQGLMELYAQFPRAYKESNGSEELGKLMSDSIGSALTYGLDKKHTKKLKDEYGMISEAYIDNRAEEVNRLLQELGLQAIVIKGADEAPSLTQLMGERSKKATAEEEEVRATDNREIDNYYRAGDESAILQLVESESDCTQAGAAGGNTWSCSWKWKENLANQPFVVDSALSSPDGGPSAGVYTINMRGIKTLPNSTNDGWLLNVDSASKPYSGSFERVASE